jgi:hypothetical protein
VDSGAKRAEACLPAGLSTEGRHDGVVEFLKGPVNNKKAAGYKSCSFFNAFYFEIVVESGIKNSFEPISPLSTD